MWQHTNVVLVNTVVNIFVCALFSPYLFINAILTRAKKALRDQISLQRKYPNQHDDYRSPSKSSIEAVR